jgi:hypothetical protein
LVIPTGQSTCHVINQIAVDADTSVVGSRDQHNLQERWLKKLCEKPGADLVQEYKRPKLIPKSASARSLAVKVFCLLARQTWSGRRLPSAIDGL